MADLIELHSARLLLRTWRAADLEPFAALCADPQVMRYFPATQSREEVAAMIERIGAHFTEHGFGLWALERKDNGAFIGFTGLGQVGFAAPFNRPLKNVGEAGKTRQKQARKRSLRVVNEHSEPVFNAVLPTQVVFQQPVSPAVEIGWRLAREHWGQGFASEAARAALTCGFQRLGLEQIVAFTALDNQPSQRVMQAIGMRRDPAEDFDHPKLPPGHALRRHMLYRLQRDEWRAGQ